MDASEIPEALIEAYRATRFMVFDQEQPFALRIGERSERLASLMARHQAEHATFITAENPASMPTSAEENVARQAALKRELDALGAVVIAGSGQGADPAWPAEASWLAVGITREAACLLGAAYGQNAIVCISHTAVPELVLLR